MKLEKQFESIMEIEDSLTLDVNLTGQAYTKTDGQQQMLKIPFGNIKLVMSKEGLHGLRVGVNSDKDIEVVEYYLMPETVGKVISMDEVKAFLDALADEVMQENSIEGA